VLPRGEVGMAVLWGAVVNMMIPMTPKTNHNLQSIVAVFGQRDWASGGSWYRRVSMDASGETGGD